MLTNAVGDVGSGKTLLMTGMALRDTRQVLANYKIRIPNWKQLKPEMLFTLDKPSLVLIDEAYIFLESRRSGTAMPIYMSYILFQSRKRGIDIVLSDQIEDTIEKRYRLMMNRRIECENLGDMGFLYYVSDRVRGGFTIPRRFFLPIESAEVLFPLYDTLQIINPIDEKMLYTISEDKEETIEKVDRIVAEILKKVPPTAVKKGLVADYCLRNKEPHYLVELVFNSIKTKIAENIYYPSYRNKLKRAETDD